MSTKSIMRRGNFWTDKFRGIKCSAELLLLAIPGLYIYQIIERCFMSIFEIIMLVCFGAAWPVSIYKSLKSRSVKGKSLFFLLIVLAGYGAGILHKIFFLYDGVIILYLVNFCMISVDVMLYFRYKVTETEV